MTQFQLSLYLLALVFLEAVNGLQCHDCSYSKYGNEESGNQLCKKPKGDYKQLTLTGCYNDKSYRFGCGKVAAKDGKLSADNTISVEVGVYRNCVETKITDSSSPPEGCTVKTVAQWENGTDAWSEWVAQVARWYSKDTTVEACYCKDDECNAAPSLAVSICALGLIALSAITAVFKL